MRDARPASARAQRGAEPPAIVVAVVELAQLDPQQGGLEARPGAPSCRPRGGGSAASRRASAAGGCARRARVGGHDRAAVAPAAEVLRRVEAEAADVADAADAAAAVEGAVRLARVLDHAQVRRAGDLEDRIQVDRRAHEVHGMTQRVRGVDRRVDGLGGDQVGRSGRRRRTRGVAPTQLTASAVAMNEFVGTITSSPGPMPSARSASEIASVPERDADRVIGLAVGGELGLEGLELGCRS